MYIPQANKQGLVLGHKLHKVRAEDMDNKRREIVYTACQCGDIRQAPECPERALVLRALAGYRMTDDETARVWKWMDSQGRDK